eukprot:PhM_4_TR11522/c0_g1_i1/m.92829
MPCLHIAHFVPIVMIVTSLCHLVAAQQVSGTLTGNANSTISVQATAAHPPSQICFLTYSANPSLVGNIYLGMLKHFERAQQSNIQFRAIVGASARELMRGVFQPKYQSCDVFVGPGLSTLTILLQPLLPRLQIEYAAGASDLDDTKQFPYFSRVNPSAQQQAFAAVDTIFFYGWSTFTILTTADTFTASLTASSVKRAQENDMVISQVVYVPVEGDESSSDIAFASAQETIVGSPTRILLLNINPSNPTFRRTLDMLITSGISRSHVLVGSSGLCSFSLDHSTRIALSGTLCSIGAYDSQALDALRRLGSQSEGAMQTATLDILRDGGLAAGYKFSTSALFAAYSADATYFAIRLLELARQRGVNTSDLSGMYNGCVHDLVLKDGDDEGYGQDLMTGSSLQINTTSSLRQRAAMSVATWSRSGAVVLIGTWNEIDRVNITNVGAMTWYDGSKLVPGNFKTSHASTSGSSKSTSIIVSAIVGAAIIMFIVVVTWKYTESRRQMWRLHRSDRVATELAESVARMDFGSLGYLEMIEHPTRIQTAFIEIVRALKEYRSYMPASLFAGSQSCHDAPHLIDDGDAALVNLAAESQEMSYTSVVSEVAAAAAAKTSHVTPLRQYPPQFFHVALLGLRPRRPLRPSPQLTADMAGAAVNDLIEKAVTVAESNHGVPIVFAGDNITFSFGAPRRCTKRVRSCCLTLLQLDDATVVPCTLGATHGVALCGDFGTSRFRAFSVCGELTNELAMLMSVHEMLPRGSPPYRAMVGQNIFEECGGDVAHMRVYDSIPISSSGDRKLVVVGLLEAMRGINVGNHQNNNATMTTAGLLRAEQLRTMILREFNDAAMVLLTSKNKTLAQEFLDRREAESPRNPMLWSLCQHMKVLLQQSEGLGVMT